MQNQNNNRSPGRRTKDKRNLWSFNILLYTCITTIIVCASTYAAIFFGGYIFRVDIERPPEIAEGLRLGAPYAEMRSKLASLETIVVKGDKVGQVHQNGVLYTLRFTSPKHGEKVWQITYRNNLKNISAAEMEKHLADTYGLPMSVDCFDKINCAYTFFLPLTLVVVKTTQYGTDILLNVSATDIYYGGKK